MAETILTWDFSKNLNAVSGGSMFKKIENCKVECQIDGDVAKALKESKDKDLGYAKMHEKLVELCKEVEADLAKKLKETKSKYKGTDSKTKHEMREACRKEISKELEDLRAEMKKLPEELWKKFVAKYAAAKKEYKDFKINSGVKIAVGALEVAGAVAGTVGSHGAGLALGIVGAVRGVAGIANVVHTLAKDVEKFGKELLAAVNAMADEFNKGKKEKFKEAAKDLGKTAVNVIVGTDAFPTVATVGGKAKDMSGKVAGSLVGGQKLSRKVTECFDAIEKLETELKKLPEAKRKKVQEKLEKLQKGFTSLFEAAADLNAKAERADKLLEAIEEALKRLKSDFTKGLSFAEKGIDIIVKLGLAAANAGTGFASAAGKGLEIANTSINLANDLLSTAKDAVDG
jgi:predicted nuclease with TOPRIM domain